MASFAIVDVGVADGTGGALRRCDVLVDGPWIAAVVPAGDLVTAGATVEPGRGLVLAPGFIDVHSHADNAPLLAEAATSKILQGVTTEVVGNCGTTLGPRGVDPADFDALIARSRPPMSATWHSTAELYAELDRRGYVTNAAPLVGHHALRALAMGMAATDPTPDQLATMGSALDEAVAAGAFGLSTGLIYPPGVFSHTEELVWLASRLPEHCLYTSHIRGEGPHLVRSVEEAVRIGRESRRRVQISHLKSKGRQQWGAIPGVLALLDEARASGVDVRHDVYPYTASSTSLTALLPHWVQQGGNAGVLDRLADGPTVERIRHEIEAGPTDEWEDMAFGAGWDNIVIASTRSGTGEGMTLTSLGRMWGVAPFDAVVRVLRSEELRATMIVHQMAEEDLMAGLRHPCTMIGSDGLAPGTGGKPHPRTYGTFPRVLARYVRELQVLDLAEAIRRMTSLPAETFRIPDRGVVREGAIADLVLFDPATVTDHATYPEPRRPPSGIAWVMQEGRFAVRDGVFAGVRAGRRLRPTAA